MECREVEEMLPDYVQHSLGVDRTLIVEEHLRTCGYCRAEVELWNRLGSIPDTRPPGAMRARFNQALAAYEEGRNEQRWWSMFVRPSWTQAAAACLLVALAFVAGVFVERSRSIDTQLASMQQELATTRQMVAISLLQNQSASDRLEGVVWSKRLSQANREVLEALLDTLRLDESVDVRLAALDALRRYSGDPLVRSAVRDSLDHQRSPMVQIAVVDFVVKSRDRDAVNRLENLARSPNLLPEVREKVQWGINQLNRG